MISEGLCIFILLQVLIFKPCFCVFYFYFFIFLLGRSACPSCAGALQSPNPGAGQPEPWTQSLYGLSSHPEPCQSRRGSQSVPPFRVPRRVRILSRTLPPTPTTTAATARPTPGGEPAFTPPSEKQKLGLLSRPGHPRPGYAPLRALEDARRGSSALSTRAASRHKSSSKSRDSRYADFGSLDVRKAHHHSSQSVGSAFKQRLRPHQREAQETASAQTGHGWWVLLILSYLYVLLVRLRWFSFI